MTVVYSPYEGYLVSAPAVTTTGNWFDLRGSNGCFLLWTSGSGLAAGAANSAVLTVQHSFDQTALTTLVIQTASAPSVITAQYSAGAYAYLRAIATVYSGSTGTGAPYMYLLPGHV